MTGTKGDGGTKGPLRVLVVEDEKDHFDLLIRELRKGGYEPAPVRVETAEELVAALERQPWDIVFSDWALPRFNALRALGVLREKAEDLPCIIVSGTVGEDVAVEALRAGARDFLLKSRLARLIPALERELSEAMMRKERAQMQQQLMISDRMASVGILAAGLAHEINNPLASVLANLQMVVRDLSEQDGGQVEAAQVDDLRDALSDARDAAEQIRSIVRDLKLFSRSEDEEKRGPVDVRRVLESTLRMARNEIRHRARLVERYGPVPQVEGNESRLGQVFLNLVVNAAQAIPEGRADANEVRVSTAVDARGRVVVEIADTGTGIPPAVLKSLFSPFFTTKPAGMGTGLGLSICHRIVSSLGGEITVESEVGKGTTFRVHLPPSSGAAEVVAEPAVPSTQAARRGRILVVDDEPAILNAVRRAIGREHDLVMVGRAREAVEKIASGERYDVIISDLMMPEMTGMDLYSELQRAASDQAERMIFLTGGAFTPRAQNFLDDVPNLRIEKPFDTIALRAVVNDRVR